MPPSTPSQSWSVILPARSSSQYFQLSEPEPSTLPCQLPRSIGPAGRKIAGRFMLVAPSSRPGVVLSQPPISTAPSIGWERSSSSVSIASMLRYSMVVGLTKLSDRRAPAARREAARHQDAALHVLHPGLEVAVAGLQVGPGVDDGDHRLAGPFLRRVAHLHRAASGGRTSAGRRGRTSGRSAGRPAACAGPAARRGSHRVRAAAVRREGRCPRRVSSSVPGIWRENRRRDNACRFRPAGLAGSGRRACRSEARRISRTRPSAGRSTGRRNRSATRHTAAGSPSR